MRSRSLCSLGVAQWGGFGGALPHAPQGSAAPLTPCGRRDRRFSHQRLCRLNLRENAGFSSQRRGFSSQHRSDPLAFLGSLFIGLFFWVSAALLFSTQLYAHQIGLSKGTYTLQHQNLLIEWDLARGDLISLLPHLDNDRNKDLSQIELQSAQQPIAALFAKRILVWQDKTPCHPTLTQTRLLEKDGVSVQMRYRCPSFSTPIRWQLDLLDDLAPGHRHIAMIHADKKTHQQVFYRGQHQHLLDRQIHKATAQAYSPSAFFVLGIEHILFGWDHLLFLFALILLGGSFRALLAVVTAFTIAHSITLSIAVFGYWTPSPKIIEPLIALSVAYVGLENFFLDDLRRRWRLTFAFGLIHGFGFAGALETIQFPPQQTASSLFLFNLGVETGQIALLSLLLPLLHLARQKMWLNTRMVRILSAFVLFAGGYWFFARIFS